jgi:hypothetical protein
MKKGKLLPGLVGRVFGKDPVTQANIYVIYAVDVTAFCSSDFRRNRGVAIMEYSKLSQGPNVVSFKTKYEDSGDNCFTAGVPIKFDEIEAPDFMDIVRGSWPSGVALWGIGTHELIGLVLTKWEFGEFQLELQFG